jgi:hypothetical protein
MPVQVRPIPPSPTNYCSEAAIARTTLGPIRREFVRPEVLAGGGKAQAQPVGYSVEGPINSAWKP